MALVGKGVGALPRPPKPLAAQQFLWLFLALTTTLWATRPHAHWFNFAHHITILVGVVIVVISETWPLELGRGNISLASAGYFSVYLVAGPIEAFWTILIGTAMSWLVRGFRGLVTAGSLAMMVFTLSIANGIARLDPGQPVVASVMFASSFLVVNHLLVNLYYFLRDGRVKRKEVLESLGWDGLGWAISLPLAAIYVLLDRAYHQWWVGFLGLLPYVTVSLLLSFYYQTRSSQRATRKTAKASAAITAAMSREEVAQRVQSAYADVVGFTLFVMYLLDPGTGLLRREAAVHPGAQIPYPEIFDRGGEGLTDWALATRTPEFIGNARDYPSANPAPTDDHPLLSGFILPLVAEHKIWGIIVLGHDHPNGYSRHDFDMVKMLADHTAVAYRKWMLRQEAVELSRVDPLLPEVYNYRYFRQVVDWRIANWGSRSMALAFLDMDRFKGINDQFGHFVGDDVLRAFSRLVQSELREFDVFARYGGDEFVLLFDNVDALGAAAAVARIQYRLARENWANMDIPLGVSAGVALYPEDGNSPELLLNAADLRMYENKLMRRNKIHSSPAR